MVAAIAGQHVDIFDGHIQLVAARIFQSDAIVRAVAYRDGGQPLIASNAVIGMHEQIAGRQRRQFLQESRSEEHTSELQSLMRISYAVFCLNKKKEQKT